MLWWSMFRNNQNWKMVSTMNLGTSLTRHWSQKRKYLQEMTSKIICKYKMASTSKRR
ncbi:unnamed protein product [Arabidopsis halleri]